MRMLFVKAVLVVGALVSAVAADGGADGVNRYFLKNGDGKHDFMALMNTHFDSSVKYMLTSKQYGSQYMERPGMAKLLLDASDREWEEGMDVLKKFMQRGGKIGPFNNAINITAKAQLPDYTKRFDSYTATLDGLLTDAKDRFTTINALHQDSNRHSKHQNPNHIPDYDIGHFLDKKLSEEAETIYKLTSHKTTLAQMINLGVAVSMFDEAL